MLADATVARLDQQLVLMRIIHFALALGVLGFAVVSLVLAGGELKRVSGPMDWMMAGTGVAFGLASWIVPRLIPLPRPTADADETKQALAIAGGFQTALILSCAMLEGGAFANLSRYFTDHIALNLAVAGALWLILLLHFPRRGALLDHVERRLRELREEQALAAAGR